MLQVANHDPDDHANGFANGRTSHAHGAEGLENRSGGYGDGFARHRNRRAPYRIRRESLPDGVPRYGNGGASHGNGAERSREWRRAISMMLRGIRETSRAIRVTLGSHSQDTFGDSDNQKSHSYDASRHSDNQKNHSLDASRHSDDRTSDSRNASCDSDNRMSHSRNTHFHPDDWHRSTLALRIRCFGSRSALDRNGHTGRSA